MNKTDLIRKLTSRKFFAFLAGFITSILIALNASENEIAQATAIITSFGAVVAYIFAEASVDKSKQNEGDSL